MNTWKSIYAIVAKDVRSELRTRYALNALLMFVIIGFITWPIFWIYNIVDAYRVAKKASSP